MEHISCLVLFRRCNVQLNTPPTTAHDRSIRLRVLGLALIFYLPPPRAAVSALAPPMLPVPLLDGGLHQGLVVLLMLLMVLKQDEINASIEP
jgi:hypothetical protein